MVAEAISLEYRWLNSVSWRTRKLPASNICHPEASNCRLTSLSSIPYAIGRGIKPRICRYADKRIGKSTAHIVSFFHEAFGRLSSPLVPKRDAGADYRSPRTFSERVAPHEGKSPSLLDRDRHRSLRHKVCCTIANNDGDHPQARADLARSGSQRWGTCALLRLR